MAIHTTKSKASIRRAQPVRIYPSTISMTPLISGTPGIKYKTLVAKAISDVVLKIRAVEEHKDATKADTMKII